jgi:hypothetical protein
MISFSSIDLIISWGQIIINAWKKDMLNKWFEKDGTRSATYARVAQLASRSSRDADEDPPCKLKKLLNEVFPEHIANQLKEGKKVRNVPVMFPECDCEYVVWSC